MTTAISEKPILRRYGAVRLLIALFGGGGAGVALVGSSPVGHGRRVLT